jgi:hypothetical protein
MQVEAESFPFGKTIEESNKVARFVSQREHTRIMALRHPI